jgi:uncharacterized protein YbaP (TraB family)
VATGCILASPNLRAASVWKVSGPGGGELFLGGSVHALATSDYPLPPAYKRALDACRYLVFEVDPKAFAAASKGFLKAAEYPKGDSLKNHVDPRTYDYLRRFFKALNVPEAKFSMFRPWCLAFMLEAPQLHGLSSDLGVEGFLTKQAKSKPISGLESLNDSIRRYSGLTDKQGETMLLLQFIPGEPDSMSRIKEAWRRGDSETVWRITNHAFRDVPSIGEREITARNHNWIPQIERFLESGHKYFVVVGAAHMGGPDGLLALLRQGGCRIEQF